MNQLQLLNNDERVKKEAALKNQNLTEFKKKFPGQIDYMISEEETGNKDSKMS